MNGAGSTQELQLRVDCDLFIRGRIGIRGGGRVGAAAISSFSEFGVLAGSVTDEQFLLGPVSSGLHHLRARAYGNLASSAYEDAWPGDEDLLLELLPGASLAGRFVDAESGEECEAAIVTSCATSGYLSAGIQPRPGPFRVEGLSAGRYDLAAHTADGRVGVLRGVELETGQAKHDLLIRVEPGAILSTRYSGPSTYGELRLLHEGALVAGDRLRSGASTKFYVPPGKILVQLRLGVELIEEREVVCEVGEQAEVIFSHE